MVRGKYSVVWTRTIGRRLYKDALTLVVPKLPKADLSGVNRNLRIFRPSKVERGR